jgi:hypothetical protein
LAFKTPINTDLQKKTTCKKLPISCQFLTKFDQIPKNSLFLPKKLPIFDPPDFLNKIQQTTQKMSDRTRKQDKPCPCPAANQTMSG